MTQALIGGTNEVFMCSAGFCFKVKLGLDLGQVGVLDPDKGPGC